MRHTRFEHPRLRVVSKYLDDNDEATYIDHDHRVSLLLQVIREQMPNHVPGRFGAMMTIG